MGLGCIRVGLPIHENDAPYSLRVSSAVSLRMISDLQPGIVFATALPQASDFALATVNDGGVACGRVHHCFVSLIEVKVAQLVAQARMSY